MTFNSIVNFVKSAKRGQATALLYDDCGCGDNACARVYFYKRHFSDDDRSVIICEDRDGHTHEIEDHEVDSVVKLFYIKKGLKKKFHMVREDKSPKSKSKHVGVEIEFMSQLSTVELEAALAEAGLEKYVTAKDDGSIDCEDDYPYSHEVCILATEKVIAKVIEKFCKIIAGNSTVNQSCGLHVHLDMRHRDKELAYRNLWAAQPLLYSMCPKSRVKGGYSKPIQTYHSIADDPNGDERYVGVNKESLSKHKTLEIRIHSGTINAKKITNWVRLLTRIAEARNFTSADAVTLCKSLEVAEKSLKLRGELAKYVKNRVSKFTPHHKESAWGIAA